MESTMSGRLRGSLRGGCRVLCVATGGSLCHTMGHTPFQSILNIEAWVPHPLRSKGWESATRQLPTLSFRKDGAPNRGTLQCCEM